VPPWSEEESVSARKSSVQVLFACFNLRRWLLWAWVTVAIFAIALFINSSNLFQKLSEHLYTVLFFLGLACGTSLVFCLELYLGTKTLKVILLAKFPTVELRPGHKPTITMDGVLVLQCGSKTKHYGDPQGKRPMVQLIYEHVCFVFPYVLSSAVLRWLSDVSQLSRSGQRSIMEYGHHCDIAHVD
jgi:hypothetical protein